MSQPIKIPGGGTKFDYLGEEISYEGDVWQSREGIILAVQEFRGQYT